MTDPICERNIAEFSSGFLTGFTRRGAAALIHLADAWCVADPTNTPGIVCAMWHVLTTRSMADNRESMEDLMTLGMGDDLRRKLLFEIGTLDSDAHPTIVAGEPVLEEDDTCVVCNQYKKVCCDTGYGCAVCADCCDGSRH